jgi:hypothetical protein
LFNMNVFMVKYHSSVNIRFSIGSIILFNMNVFTLVLTGEIPFKCKHEVFYWKYNLDQYERIHTGIDW